MGTKVNRESAEIKARTKIAGGPGLKDVHSGREPWYGIGCCGICGDSGEDLIPRRVRYWDPDDGWRSGVLCEYCADDCRERGPAPDDYACVVNSDNDSDLTTDEKIDLIAELLGDDFDGAQGLADDLMI